MIDRQLFNETFQYFEPSMTIEIIDDFKVQQQEIILTLAKNIESADIIQIKLNAHKLKGPCGQFFDQASAGDAKNLEDAASKHIIEIVYGMLEAYPDKVVKLQQENTQGELVYKVLFVAKSIQGFIEDQIGQLTPEMISKLMELTKAGFPQRYQDLLNNLRISSSLLVEELSGMKTELSGNL